MRLSRWITFPLLMGILAALPAVIIRNEFWLLETLIRFVIGAAIGFGTQAWSDHRTRQRVGAGEINDEIYRVRQTRSVTVFGHRGYVLSLCQRAVEDLGNTRLKYIDAEKGEIEARVKMNWDSFGTLITMTVAQIGNNLSEVTIGTRPRFTLTRVDYGRGLEAVDKLTEFLKKNDGNVNTGLLKEGAEILVTATKRPLAKDLGGKGVGSSE